MVLVDYVLLVLPYAVCTHIHAGSCNWTSIHLLLNY